jgi:hypothetical protein
LSKNQYFTNKTTIANATNTKRAVKLVDAAFLVIKNNNTESNTKDEMVQGH